MCIARALADIGNKLGLGALPAANGSGHQYSGPMSSTMIVAVSTALEFEVLVAVVIEISRQDATDTCFTAMSWIFTSRSKNYSLDQDCDIRSCKECSFCIDSRGCEAHQPG